MARALSTPTTTHEGWRRGNHCISTSMAPTSTLPRSTSRSERSGASPAETVALARELGQRARDVDEVLVGVPALAHALDVELEDRWGQAPAVEHTHALDDTRASGVVYLEARTGHDPPRDRHRREGAQTTGGAHHVPGAERVGGDRLHRPLRAVGQPHHEADARARRGNRLPLVLVRLLALGEAASRVAPRGPGHARRGGRAGRGRRRGHVRGPREPGLAAPLSPCGRGLGPGGPALCHDPGHARRLARVLAGPPEPVPPPGRAEWPRHPVLRVHGGQHELVPAPHPGPPGGDELGPPGQERGAGEDRGPGSRSQRAARGAAPPALRIPAQREPRVQVSADRDPRLRRVRARPGRPERLLPARGHARDARQLRSDDRHGGYPARGRPYRAGRDRTTDRHPPRSRGRDPGDRPGFGPRPGGEEGRHHRRLAPRRAAPGGG